MAATEAADVRANAASWARLAVEWPSDQTLRALRTNSTHQPIMPPHPRSLSFEFDGLPWQFAAIFMIKGERLTKFQRLTHFQR